MVFEEINSISKKQVEYKKELKDLEKIVEREEDELAHIIYEIEEELHTDDEIEDLDERKENAIMYLRKIENRMDFLRKIIIPEEIICTVNCKFKKNIKECPKNNNSKCIYKNIALFSKITSF